jgi:Ca2+-binding RTX toxin-like protein
MSTGGEPIRAAVLAVAIVLAHGAIQPAATRAAPSCEGRAATIVGTPGDDVINGTRRDDVIVAGGGDDRIDGGGGADLICGGPGADRIDGDLGADRLVGSGGADVLRGSAQPDRIEGGHGRDILSGGQADDRLDGGTGGDACLQGGGNGRLTRCENANADLAVLSISCPSSATLDVPFECQVTSVNDGPEPAHILLEGQARPKCISVGCSVAWGTGWTFHDVDHADAGALLPPGQERTDVVQVTITQWPADGTPAVRITIRPVDLFDAIDPVPSNDDFEAEIAQA